MTLRHHHTRGQGMASVRARDRLVAELRAQGISNGDVLAAIGRVDRYAFLDEALTSRAYDNTALPIGYGQTISQPYVVARMTSLLLECEQPVRVVLEVGTGSGYQAAVLAELGLSVYSTERIRPLHELARQRLRGLGYRRVHTRLSDGTMGLPDYGPFEAIMVTARGEQVPPDLLGQLCVGGRLVMPVGDASGQQLVTVDRLEDGWKQNNGEAVSFVPLVSGLYQESGE